MGTTDNFEFSERITRKLVRDGLISRRIGVRVGRVEGKGRCCQKFDNKRLNRRVEVSCP